MASEEEEEKEGEGGREGGRACPSFAAAAASPLLLGFVVIGTFFSGHGRKKRARSSSLLAVGVLRSRQAAWESEGRKPFASLSSLRPSPWLPTLSLRDTTSEGEEGRERRRGGKGGSLQPLSLSLSPSASKIAGSKKKEKGKEGRKEPIFCAYAKGGGRK